MSVSVSLNEAPKGGYSLRSKVVFPVPCQSTFGETGWEASSQPTFVLPTVSVSDHDCGRKGWWSKKDCAQRFRCFLRCERGFSTRVCVESSVTGLALVDLDVP